LFVKAPPSWQQGKSIYFLIVKISLNSPEFPGKTNHKGHEGHKGCMKQHVIPSFCAFVVKNSSMFWQISASEK
jgi:hypothetical protein